jgi:hypothetical protein
VRFSLPPFSFLFDLCMRMMFQLMISMTLFEFLECRVRCNNRGEEIEEEAN